MRPQEALDTRKPGIEGEHVIGEFVGDVSGATLIAVGSLHGNEPGGMLALTEVAEKLETMRAKVRGRVYLLAGNSRALESGVRFIDTDLNRYWTPENIQKNRAGAFSWISENREQVELLEIFDGILTSARDEVYVLDLHSTSARGLPFATVGDTMRNREFARQFPVTILLGIEEQLDGTMLEYLNNAGAVTLGFEGGQHDSRNTVVNHEALLWLALANTGIIAPEDIPEFDEFYEKLTINSGRARLLEVRYREAVEPGDDFEMLPGYRNFDPVRQGEKLADNRKGPVRAPETGLILMPLYQKQGEDGFFIGREIAPFWVWLSGVLRKLGVPGMVRYLPGVVRDPDNAENLIVNTSVARLFPLQIFHLLGFRKRRWRGERLIVSRRKHDRVSPFQARGR